MIEPRIWSAGERAKFHVEVLAARETEGEELVVRILAVEVLHDLRRAPPQHRVAAQRVRAHPVAHRRAVGEDFCADELIDVRVVVREQCQQRGLLAFGERSVIAGDDWIHGLHKK
ncbi:MAG: hypothetical protein HY300_09515 [Verrucomicrobia bacterium]|nr:hypothetical protein [Verrucomicrobiota bacterium]